MPIRPNFCQALYTDDLPMILIYSVLELENRSRGTLGLSINESSLKIGNSYTGKIIRKGSLNIL